MNGHADPIARISSLPLWRGSVRVRPLDGGLTNQNFVVESHGQTFVARLGRDIPVHGIVRAHELAASLAAHAAGLSPAVVHAEHGILITAFIEGRTLTAQDVCNPANLDRLIDLVRRCHRDVPRFLRGGCPMFWVFHVVRDYAHRLRGESSRYAGVLPNLLEKSARLELAVGAIDVVFGHNDLLAANLIDDGRRLWLIDWEYAGFNSPLFDLGGLASNSQMPKAQAEALIAAYFDRPIDDDLRRRGAAMTAASLLREAMWSMVSESHSSLPFDYQGYTAENLSRFALAYAEFLQLETL